MVTSQVAQLLKEAAAEIKRLKDENAELRKQLSIVKEASEEDKTLFGSPTIKDDYTEEIPVNSAEAIDYFFNSWK